MTNRNEYPIDLELRNYGPTPKPDKLTRRERRELGRKLRKPKYQKIAKRIIDHKNK